MINRIRFAVVTVVLAAMTGSQNDTQAESVKVFIMSGHSLMLGVDRVENLDPSWNVPQDDVWIWLDHNMDGIGNWVTLEPGHGGPTHIPRPNEPEGITVDSDGHLKVGPELGLGRALADVYPEDRIVIIKHGRGGGTLGTDWNPENVGPPESEDYPWSGLLKKTSDALEALTAAGDTYEVAGFFWSLGGRDARNWNSGSSNPNVVEAGREDALARSAEYGENLENFIGAVRNEFGDDLPFVMEVFPTDYDPFVYEAYPGVNVVRQAQIDVSAMLPHTAGVSATGIARLSDGVHYDAMGSVELGQRYAHAYLDLVSQQVPCDYNGDGVVDVSDVDLQAIAMSESKPDLAVYDENKDGMVDELDRAILVHEHADTFYGDVNLDGEFNSSDLVKVFTAGKYEMQQGASWSEGDWNGDGVFGSGDLVLAFQDGGYEQGPRTAPQAVPEPTSLVTMLTALVARLAAYQRRRISDVRHR